MRGDVSIGIMFAILVAMAFAGSLIAMFFSVYIIVFRKPVLRGSFVEIVFYAFCIAALASISTYVASFIYTGFAYPPGGMFSDGVNERLQRRYLSEIDIAFFPFFVEIFFTTLIPNIVYGILDNKPEAIKIKFGLICNGTWLFIMNRVIYGSMTGEYLYVIPKFSIGGNLYTIFQLSELVYMIFLVVYLITGDENFYKRNNSSNKMKN